MNTAMFNGSLVSISGEKGILNGKNNGQLAVVNGC